MAKNNIKGITIKFDGNTTKLEKAMKKVISETRDIDKELKDVNRALKFDPKNTVLLSQKQELLGQKIESTKTQLEKFRNMQDQLSAKGVDENSSEWRTLEREIEKTSGKLDYFKKEVKKMDTAKLEELGNKFETVGGKMKDAGEKMSKYVTAPIVGGFAYSAKAASDFEENINKVDVAFGKSSQSVKDWADTATTQFGLSKNSALEAASLFGDMGTSMGLSQKEAASMSTELAGLAGDLSSFKNIDVDQAMTALKGVFTGETESLKELGVVMTQDNLKQFASDAGLIYDEMSQAEKVQLRYNYVLAQTKNAQGDYARTSDGTANSIRTFKESLNNLAVVIGQEILPVITPIIQKLGEWIQKFSEMSPTTKKMVVIIGAVVAAIGPLLVIIGTVISAIGTIMGVMAGFEVAALAAAAPILGIVAAVAMVIAIIVACIKHWDQIKEVVAAVADAMKVTIEALVIMFRKKIADLVLSIKAKIQTAKSFLKSLAETTKNVFKSVINHITAPYKRAWNLIKTIISKIKGLFPFHVKMPHLSLSPQGWTPSDILSGVIPSIGINWYKNGGMFNSPSVIGVGEAGSEAVVPLDQFWGKMDSMTASIVSAIQIGMSGAGNCGAVNVTVELGGTKVGEQIVKLYDRTKKAVG